MMPGKERNAVVSVDSDDLTLPCEWDQCSQVFATMTAFTEHVNAHLLEHFKNSQGEFAQADNGEGRACLWRYCDTILEGSPENYLRHVYFHLFHTKIKCVGSVLLGKTGRQPCMLETDSRNMIPELPESLVCSWEDCQTRTENADLFYQHVQSHISTYEVGNDVKGGCKCLWEGCSTVTKSRHKLKDHLKSHTQEKVVACPTCGALFSCRTKFYDHLTRQAGYSTGKQYQCSHCYTMFGTERLLRDHMRYHVNQYKCPYCDMTSPAPSNIQLHIKYRHTTEKPFQCDTCQYSAKTMTDLRRHQALHRDEDVMLQCQVPLCEFTAKTLRSLEVHFQKEHERENQASYECHVCNTCFTRGAQLSKHLRSKHKFNCPSGHSRFRYKLHTDGKWRLQTVRYESIELTTSEDQTGLPIVVENNDDKDGTVEENPAQPERSELSTLGMDEQSLNMPLVNIKQVSLINVVTDNKKTNRNNSSTKTKIGSMQEISSDSNTQINKSKHEARSPSRNKSAPSHSDEVTSDDEEQEECLPDDDFETGSHGDSHADAENIDGGLSSPPSRNNSAAKSTAKMRSVQRKTNFVKTGRDMNNSKTADEQSMTPGRQLRNGKVHTVDKGISPGIKNIPVNKRKKAFISASTQKCSTKKVRCSPRRKNANPGTETTNTGRQEGDSGACPGEEMAGAVTIHIVKDDQGHFVIQGENGSSDTHLAVHEPDSLHEQETMYNLNMLGDVALLNQGQTH